MTRLDVTDTNIYPPKRVVLLTSPYEVTAALLKRASDVRYVSKLTQRVFRLRAVLVPAYGRRTAYVATNKDTNADTSFDRLVDLQDFLREQ